MHLIENAVLSEMIARGLARELCDGSLAMEVPVAGFRYHDGPDIFPYLVPGESLDLIAEPGNPYDEWAVRIEHKKSRIGYIPRGPNQLVSALLQAGTDICASIMAVNPQATSWECIKIQMVIRSRKRAVL